MRALKLFLDKPDDEDDGADDDDYDDDDDDDQDPDDPDDDEPVEAEDIDMHIFAQTIEKTIILDVEASYTIDNVKASFVLFISICCVMNP